MFSIRVECMWMQQLDIFNFWHERNVWERHCSIKINLLRFAFHITHMKALQSSTYICNLIISRPNCNLSIVVFQSHSSPYTPKTICPIFVHVFHNSFASVLFGQSVDFEIFIYICDTQTCFIGNSKEKGATQHQKILVQTFEFAHE